MDELDKSQQVQLDALGEEYGRKHGTAIEFIKAVVQGFRVHPCLSSLARN